MMLLSPAQVNYMPARIVSLVPSQTELLFDLGLDKSVVGITKFCVHPPHWKIAKAIIGGTKNINIKKIKALNPDLIIANKEENVKEQIEELAKECNVWLTDVAALPDALQMIIDIGVITGSEIKSKQLITSIETNFTNIKKLEQQLKVCYLIWRNPYITTGGDTFINDMLTRCGFQNIFADKNRYPAIEIEELKKADFDLLILSSEPYPFKQKHTKELQQQLPGIKIILTDGEMFSWYGSRLLHAPAYFQKLIYKSLL